MKNVLIFNQITVLWDPFLQVVSGLSTNPILVKSAKEIAPSAYGRNVDLAFVHVDDHLYLDTEIIAMIRMLSPAAVIVVYGQTEHERYLQAGAQLFFDNFSTVEEMKSRLAAWFSQPA